jgi:hypothetical protein
MKKIYSLLLLVLVVVSASFAQGAADYSFSTSTGTVLDPMTGATTLSASANDDNATASTPIGFSFSFAGASYAHVSVSPDGFAVLGTAPFTAANDFSNAITGTVAANTTMLFPWWDDLATGTTGSVTSVLVGTAPNRIRIINWFVTQPRNTTGAANSDFQLWLYETSNVIEFRYGAATGSSADASVGILNNIGGLTFRCVTVASHTSSSTVANDANAAFNTNLAGVGRSYVFTPPSCPSPTALNTSFISNTAATLVWSNSTSGALNQVQYGPSAFVLGTGTIDTTSNLTYSVSGLTASTAYKYYVRSICGAGDSSNWSGPFNFTTLCNPVVAPFIYNVESGTATINSTIVDCWTSNPRATTALFRWDLDAAAGTPTGTTTGPSAARSGTKYFYTEGTSGTLGAQAQLFSPLIDVTALTTPYLEFYYHMRGSDIGTLNAEVWTGTAWQNVFTLSGQQQTAGTDPWLKAGIDISAFVTGVTQVRFTGIRGAAGNCDIALDDISVKEAPSCFFPSFQVNSLVLDSSAVVSFTSGGSSSWIIQYGVNGFVLGTGTVDSTGSNPYTITGLNPSTVYQWYVRDFCAVGDSSEWTGPLSFTTACTRFVAPYTYNVETAAATTNSSIADCWSSNPRATTAAYRWDVDALGGTPSTASTGPSGAFSGTKYFYTEASSGAVGNQAQLFSPLIDISALTTPYLEFYYHMRGAGMGTLNAEVWNGTAWVNVFTISGQQHLTGTDPWTKQGIDISSFVTGNLTQVRFVGVRGVDFNSDMALDNITVMEAPTCIAPSLLSTSAIGEDSAVVTFTSGGASDWIIEYGPTGFTQGTGTLVTADTSTFVLSGLNPQTAYQWYVRDSCGPGLLSLWTGPANFTTACAAVVATPYCENFNSWTDGAFGPTINTCWSAFKTTNPRWEVETSGTQNSLATGPLNDVTGAAGKYIYFETSGGVAGNTDTLTTSVFDLSTLANPRLAFSYHMFGATIGSLQVLVEDVNTGVTTLVTTISGQQQTSETAAWLRSNSYLTAFANDTVRVLFVATRSTDFTGDIAIDEFCLDEAPSCPEPVVNAIDSLTDSSVFLSWSSPFGTPNYEVEYGVNGFVLGTGTVVSTADTFTTLTGLASNTNYQYYLRAVCSAVDSSLWVGPTTFKTECSTYTPFYTTPFVTTTPACWTLANGGNATTGPANAGSTRLVTRTTINPAGSAAINFYLGTGNEWMLSPIFDLSAGIHEVEVEVAVTEFVGAGPDPTAMTGTDDQVQLLYTTDGGATWTNVTTWNAANQPAATLIPVSFVLPTTASNVQFAMWFNEGVDDVSDYDFHFNRFTLDLAPVNEIGVVDITSPQASCGAESLPITVTVENFGLADLVYVPVIVEMSGASSEIFTMVIDSLPALSTASFTIDSINTLAGGSYTFTAFTNLATDEDTSNDTTEVTLAFGAIPAAPSFATYVACEGEALELFSTSTGYFSWFTSDTSSTAFSTADTLSLTATSDTSFYVLVQGPGSTTYTIDLYDSFGDGWNGASLAVALNGSPATGSPFTLTGGSTGTVSFTVNDGDLITLNHTNGGFPDEEAYRLKDNEGTIIFEDGGGFGGANTIPAQGLVFSSTLTVLGCPSERTMVNVTVNPNSLDTVVIVACDSAVVAGNTETTSGFITDSLTSVNGCDSVIVYDVTINFSTSESTSVQICAGSSYTLPDGSVVTVDGLYNTILTTVNGCDSLIKTEVFVVPSFNVVQNLQICAGDSVVVGANTYLATGSYVDTLTSVGSCDSIVTTNLVVFPATQVAIGGLSTVCENADVFTLDLAPLGGTLSGPGVTGSSFDPALAGLGTHTLVYTFDDANGCDASASLDVEVVVCTGIDNIEGIETVSIYPNPYMETINILLDDETSGELNVSLLDITGRVILTESFITNLGSNKLILNIPAELASGITILQLERNGAIYSTHLLKK